MTAVPLQALDATGAALSAAVLAVVLIALGTLMLAAVRAGRG
jgi:hypothetical protein